MKRQFAGLLIVVTMGVGAAMAGDVAAGKIVYEKKCRICHGDNGEGNPDVAKKLKANQKPLYDPEVQKMSDADFKKAISEGTGKMKPPKNVSATDMDNVIA